MLSTSPLIYLKVVRMIVFPNSDLFFTCLFILVLWDGDLTWATFVLLTPSFSFIRPGLLSRRAPTPRRSLLSTKAINDIPRDLFLVSRSTIKWIQYRCGLSDWTTLPTTTWYVLNRLWLKPICKEFIYRYMKNQSNYILTGTTYIYYDVITAVYCKFSGLAPSGEKKRK